MITVRSLNGSDWKLSGWTPMTWEARVSMELTLMIPPECGPHPCSVPGSIQAPLLEAGEIQDWNVDLNSRHCEWLENREWVFEKEVDRFWSVEDALRLECDGLDGPGSVYVNGAKVADFDNSYLPHVFDLATFASCERLELKFLFRTPPRWLGQFGRTSLIKDFKTRFNYSWDWQPRLVQTGIWDDMRLIAEPPQEHLDLRAWTIGDGYFVQGDSSSDVSFTLREAWSGREVESFTVEPGAIRDGFSRTGLECRLWEPIGVGEQPLYDLTAKLVTGQRKAWRIGFKSVEWEPCVDASIEADPWLCVINGKPIFLQGINWTPIRPNFADVTEEEYRTRIETYAGLGINIFRVWGGAFLEKECFYNLCDEYGILVWQEFPLSSSGLDNWPPEGPAVIDLHEAIACSYIRRRQAHVSLLCWCGGNELQGAMDGTKAGIGLPVTVSHPLIARLASVCGELDPSRRFLPTSASGPHFMAVPDQFGLGKHWDVHGPWVPETDEYWEKDDALFRSELGAPGASPPYIIRESIQDESYFPADCTNPIWRRSAFWIQWEDFVRSFPGIQPTLDHFCAWSQQQQAEALVKAVTSCKNRFPRCGGVIIWMGHDSFPCLANTSLLDFHGRPKAAAEAVGMVFRASNAFALCESCS